MGCYYTVRINYEGTLNDETLEAAGAKEDEIEAEERKKRSDDGDSQTTDTEPSHKADDTPLSTSRTQASTEEQAALELAQAEAKAIAAEEYLISQLALKPVSYALCLDTLGQNRRFTPSQLAFVNKYSLKLISTLERIDRAFFKDERKRRRELKKFNSSWFERRAQDENGEEESQDAAAKLLKQGRPTTEQDVAFFIRQNIISTGLRRMLLELKNFEVLRGPLIVARAALELLGYNTADMVDSTGVFCWRKIRNFFTDELITRIRALNPRDLDAMAKLPESAQPAALTNLVESLSVQELKDVNAVLAELLGFVLDAVALHAQQVQETKEEEEAKRKAEEEAEAERIAEEERLAAEEEEARRLAEEAASEEKSGEADE
jgi:hypothetical protein